MIKNNLVLRSITGALFVALLVFCMVYGVISFVMLFATISVLASFEFCTIVNTAKKGDIRLNPARVSIASVLLFASLFTLSTGADGKIIFVFYLLFIIAMLISELYAKSSDPIGNWAYFSLSQLYIALPFGLLNVLAVSANPITGAVTYNYMLPLSVFIFLWMSDTGAFCFGSLFGKRRLFERISPKKSWEGFIGGLVVSVASGVSISYASPILSMWQWAGLALVVTIAGTWGDLVESLLKRSFNIKDSGNILPGHGGILDRFDSALLAVPAALCYLYYIQAFL